MKVLLDENVPKSLYQELRRIRRGMKDREIIELANEENRTIITLDEDFVYLSHFLRTKVILIRKKFTKKDVKELANLIENALSVEENLIILRDDYLEIVS